MAWSDPTANLTFANNEVVTHTKMNLIRDDLLETAPAKATTSGGIFVATGANALAERIPAADFETASQTTSSTSYTDLGTVGPAVTVATNTKAIVTVSALMFNDTAAGENFMGAAVTGASTAAASDAGALMLRAEGTSHRQTASRTFTYGMGGEFGALTAGSNTITAKYRVKSNATVGTFDNRAIVAFPL